MAEMNLVERALAFACEKHAGQKRKFSGLPYVLHPAEVATIAATITDCPETIAAAALHDTMEDCGISAEEISQTFGDKVLGLVKGESEDKMRDRPENETWEERKRISLEELKNCADRDAKIIWLSDKLSNMRSFYREYLKFGSEIWEYSHMPDVSKQEWYYTSVAECLKDELGSTAAFNEYVALKNKVFEEVNHG